jgi:hypothetical protein
MSSIRAMVLMMGLPFLLATSAQATQRCRDIATGPLEAETKAGKPMEEVIAALLRDAERIYTGGARLVEWKPQNQAESDAMLDKNFLIAECHFQDAFSQASKSDIEQPTRLQWTLIRIEQFDNFIFDAVKEAVSCSNTEAGLRLKVSRELLDHAWMEFKGETKERDWDPRLDWPETHESCSH